jgi:polyhydroxyalkanoate synthase
MPKPAPPTESVLPAYQVNNPQEMAQNMLRLMEQSGKVMATLAERGDGQNGPYSLAGEMAQASQAWNEVTQKLMLEPARFAEIQGDMMRDYTTLWSQTLRRMMGETVEPVVAPEPGDNRFKDPEWSANPYFDFWKQAYLLSNKCAEDMLNSAPDVDERTRAKAEFYLRQVSSACAPSNFPLTNPEVLRETFKTNAQNLVAGMELLSRDVQRSDDLLKVAQTDLDAFEVGRNLAVTPGKVVFQNDVCQLLQYAPTTPSVKARPILIVPPWINKFYILDLTQPKSLIRYLVAQGFTVFLISWVNPDGRLASKTFEDYMKEGILSATDAALRETSERSLNILGYCVGGTLLATTLAYAASRGDQSFESATFLTTQTDFTHAGDLALFVDDVQLAALKQMMAERGYLDGSRMATVFNMMRPRDLIWPYIINNYMLGKKPMP